MEDLFEEYKLNDIEYGVRLPEFKPELKHLRELDLKSSSSNYEFFIALIERGFNEKVAAKFKNNPEKLKEYRDRVTQELKLFKKLGFIDYLLILWDILNYCKEHDIARGYGRGSAAGSLILYLLNITDIDSIKHGCYFERFLSESRAKFQTIDGVNYYDGSLLMDVDVDICTVRRGEVVEHLEKKYPGKVAKILTVTTLTTKSLIKEVAKIFIGVNEEEANEISKTIPKFHGLVADIDDSIENSEDFKEFADKNPKAIEIARKIYGLKKNAGVHASAWIISYKPVAEMFPLELTKDGQLTTAFDMGDALNLAIKIDLLGLTAATMIYDVCKLVNINPKELNLDDPIIYNNLQNLHASQGIFQLADFNHSVIQKIKPRNIEQLSAAIAIARPGASQFVDAYAEFVETGNPQSIHEFFDDVLNETGGLCLYQEQLMRMINKVGFTLDDAENIRRIVGKKKIEEMATWEPRLKDKIKERNLDPTIFDILWRILEDSASYSFNKSHACSYAYLVAVTILLKFKYPLQFYISLLKRAKEEQKPLEAIGKIHSELSDFGIKLLPPHILKSGLDFTIEGNNIRYGLGSVKGVSEKTLEKLLLFKKKHANKIEIFEAAKAAGLNIGVLANLIACGSMDDEIQEGDESQRARLVYEAQIWNILTDREKVLIKDYIDKYNNRIDSTIVAMHKELKDDKGRPLIKKTRWETIYKKAIPYKEAYQHNRSYATFYKYWAENKLLGFSFSCSLKEIFNNSSEINDFIDIRVVNQTLSEERIHFAGEIIEYKQKTSRNKNRYKEYTIRDDKDEVNVKMFDNRDNFANNLEINNGLEYKEGQIVSVRGTKKDGCVFADLVKIHDVEMFERNANQ